MGSLWSWGDNPANSAGYVHTRFQLVAWMGGPQGEAGKDTRHIYPHNFKLG